MTTEYLLNRELEHVLAALTPSNELVCRVSLHTGLRVSDVLGLRTEQLAPSFIVKESKTGKKKRVGLPKVLLDAIKAQSGDVWAFPGRLDDTKHRTRQTVWRDVKRAQKAFRLDKNIGPHSMRKVYAVEMLHKYGDIERVRRSLNHGSASTTALYAIADVLLESKQKRKGKKHT